MSIEQNGSADLRLHCPGSGPWSGDASMNPVGEEE
jgi:hypothetical protein